MRPVLLLLSLLCAAVCVKAQNYDVLNYNYNALLTNGVKIKTNLPFAHGSQMPTVRIEGYCFTTSEPVGLLLTYYIYNGVFYSPRISAYGGYTPPVYLANEDGKVVIFLDSKVNNLRFTVHVFAQGRSAEVATNFQGWTAADELISDTASTKVLVPYQNRFSGNVYLPGNGIWNANGKVGIGIASPGAFLDVGPATVNTTSSVLARLPEGNTTGTGTYLGVQAYNSTPVNSNSFALEHKFYGNLNSAINFYRGMGMTGGFLTFATGNGGERMRIDGNGNVGIGTTDTKGYKFAVNGDAVFTRVKVKAFANWPDYVFESGYQLPSLQEVEKYVKENKHLPGMPAAEEVEKEGMDVGEVNRRLVEKVEELMLYVIELKRENEKQQIMIDKLTHQTGKIKK